MEHVYQVWNEVNNSLYLDPVKASTYRAMVNAVSDAVHAVDAGNLVVAGDLDALCEVLGVARNRVDVCAALGWRFLDFVAPFDLLVDEGVEVRDDDWTAYRDAAGVADPSDRWWRDQGLPVVRYDSEGRIFDAARGPLRIAVPLLRSGRRDRARPASVRLGLFLSCRHSSSA